ERRVATLRVTDPAADPARQGDDAGPEQPVVEGLAALPGLQERLQLRAGAEPVQRVPDPREVARAVRRAPGAERLAADDVLDAAGDVPLPRAPAVERVPERRRRH